jgi:hypothetical protein
MANLQRLRGDGTLLGGPFHRSQRRIWVQGMHHEGNHVYQLLAAVRLHVVRLRGGGRGRGWRTFGTWEQPLGKPRRNDQALDALEGA